MSGDPRECRLHAMRCLQLASEAPNESVKAKFVGLAGTWQALANQLEAAQALVELDNEQDLPPGQKASAVRADTGC